MTRARTTAPALFVALACALAPTARASAAADDRRPDIVFLLLDTTRADRMSAWGNPRPTTPNLDRLANSGVRFARHFANSHATRPSMPQLMSGRYYQSSVLREFRPRTHPRDWPFAAADPTLALLPEILDAAGYHLLAVSAHPWVARASRLGAPFDTFDEPSAPARRGHPDAEVVVSHALDLWRTRPRDRPTLLYLHFMDAHIPRHVPVGALRFGVEDPVARAHFDDAGEPIIGHPWHEWDRSDARAFSARDVAFFTAVYDTMLGRLDEQIARLVTALRAGDRELRNTLIVVTADHGEELGDHGRISHEASLDDAVQHVPWIMAGGQIEPGQTAWGITEHVDVVPTILDLAHVEAASIVRFDGHSVMTDGRVCSGCLRKEPVFAWEDYQGIRLGRRLARAERPRSLAAHCTGPRRLLDEGRHHAITDAAVLRGGAALMSRRLGPPARRFDAGRFSAVADRPFSVLPGFWALDGVPQVACVPVGPDTSRRALGVGGWIWTGRGVVVLRDANRTPPLPIVLEVPNGDYEISLGVRDVPAPPLFFGFAHWVRKYLGRHAPKERALLGRGTAAGNHLRVEIPATMAANRQIVAINLRPANQSGRTPADGADDDATVRERLKSLGYVE